MGRWGIVAGTLLLFNQTGEDSTAQSEGRCGKPCRQSVLTLARGAIRAAALSRTDRLATVDRAIAHLSRALDELVHRVSLLESHGEDLSG